MCRNAAVEDKTILEKGRGGGEGGGGGGLSQAIIKQKVLGA